MFNEVLTRQPEINSTRNLQPCLFASYAAAGGRGCLKSPLARRPFTYPPRDVWRNQNRETASDLKRAVHHLIIKRSIFAVAQLG